MSAALRCKKKQEQAQLWVWINLEPGGGWQLRVSGALCCRAGLQQQYREQSALTHL